MGNSVTPGAPVSDVTPSTATAGLDKLTGKRPSEQGSAAADPELTAFIEELRTLRAGRPLKLKNRSGALIDDLDPAVMGQQWKLMLEWAHNKDGSGVALDSLKAAWKVGYKEHLEFALKYQSAGWIGAPPKATGLVVIPPYIGGYGRLKSDKGKKKGKDFEPAPAEPKKYPPLAPLVATVLEKLWAISASEKQVEKIYFQAQNYAGHGGDDWSDKGYSVDLYPCMDAYLSRRHPIQEKGFWSSAIVTELIYRLDQAVTEAKASWWHVLYNDTRVIQAVNDKFGRVAAAFRGSFKKNDAGEIKANWHGPQHVGILHIHVDIHP